MKLQQINISEPDHITPDDINTLYKAKRNKNIGLTITKGKGKHHGKRYYSGMYESEDMPVKIDGKIYKSALIKTTQKGEVAEIEGYSTHDFDRLRKLAKAFNKRYDSKYAQATQKVWNMFVKEYPNYEEDNLRRKLAHWLQVYSLIEFGVDKRRKQPERFIYNNRFNCNLYDVLSEYIPLPKDNGWNSLKPYWSKVPEIKY